MADQQTAIAALERVLLTVEAELTELHSKRILEAAKPVVPVPPPPPPSQSVATAKPAARVASVASVPRPPSKPAPTFQAEWPQPVMDAPPPPPPAAPTPPPPAGPTLPPGGFSQPPASQAPRSFGFEQVLRVGGAGLVILAAIFFVSTAISRGWIGPEAQLTLATAISAALIGFSFRISADRKPWRAALAITGASALLATGVVGHLGLEILGATTTLGWMALSVLGFIGLGRAHDAESVAFAGGPAAVIAALLMFEAGASPALVTAVAITFGASVLAATWNKSWFGARSAGATAVAAITLMAALAEPLAQMTSLVLPAAVLTVVLLAASQLFDWCNDTDVSSAAAIIEARLAALTTPWAVLILSIMIAGDRALLLDSANTIGWFAILAGVAVGGVVTATRARLHPTMATLHQVAALGVVSVGLVTALSGPALMTALLAQAILSGVLAYQAKSPGAIIIAAVVGAVTVLWNGVVIFLAFAGEPMTIGEVVASGLFMVALTAAAWMPQDHWGLSRLWKGVWVGYLVWVAAVFQAVPQTQMWVSLAWAASSIAIVAGRHLLARTNSSVKAADVLNVALATLLVIGGKLIFVDLVAVDVLWRAALFLLIGGTFLRLGFILPKLRKEPEVPGSTRTAPDVEPSNQYSES